MNNAAGDVAIWGVIPAAGLSRRMGRPKQLLPYGGATIVGAITRTLLAAGVRGVAVVTRTQIADRLGLPVDPRIRVALNDDADSEMIDSIRIGLVALDELQPNRADGVLVVPADMPGIQTQTYRACIAAYLANPGHIVIAAYRGRCGHPIVFSFALCELIFRLEGGLRGLRHACPDQTHILESDDPGVLRDINTAQDYERLRPGI
jgi:molybdenum cofactor cytidylyltransferase